MSDGLLQHRSFKAILRQVIVDARRHYGFVYAQYVFGMFIFHSGIAKTYSEKLIYFFEMATLMVILSVLPILQKAIWNKLSFSINPSQRVKNIYGRVWMWLMVITIIAVFCLFASNYATQDLLNKFGLGMMVISLSMAWIWGQAVDSAPIKAKVARRHRHISLTED